MAYRVPEAAPQSQIAAERRGRTVGRFCHTCGSIYPLHRATHTGKPVYGKDHISSTCAHEGEAFDPAAPWWEPAVEVTVAVPAEGAAP